MFPTTRKFTLGYLLLAATIFVTSMVTTLAQEKTNAPLEITYRVFGLFAADREEDLRSVLKELPGLELQAIDLTRGEGTFRIDPAVALPNTKPEKYLERFDQILRQATRGTFGIRARSEIAAEKLERLEISIYGLDCKACSFAAYEIASKVEGVEHATASFREKKLTAWINPAVTDRAKLEAALKQRNVALEPPKTGN